VLHSRMAAFDKGSKPVNYYSYFSEIEEHFVRRRKKNLLVSPLDWALIQTWKEMDIPLQVALRGIDRAFDQYEAQPVKRGSVNSLFYCQQAVEQCFAEHNDSRIGQGGESPASGGLIEQADVEALLDRLSGELAVAHRRAFDLGMQELDEVFERALIRLSDISASIPKEGSPDAEVIEKDLQILDELISEAIIQAMGQEAVESWQREGKQELRPYKKRVPPEMYEKIMINYISKKARQHFSLSPFSLFAV
jgi:hypothetical protein